MKFSDKAMQEIGMADKQLFEAIHSSPLGAELTTKIFAQIFMMRADILLFSLKKTVEERVKMYEEIAKKVEEDSEGMQA